MASREHRRSLLGRRRAACEVAGHFSDNAALGLLAVSGFGKRNRLAGVKGQHDVPEQRLKRPARGQVDANATGGLAHAGSEFEEACAQRFNLCRAPGLR